MDVKEAEASSLVLSTEKPKKNRCCLIWTILGAFFVLLTILILAALYPRSNVRELAPLSLHRLPRNVIPISYKISLRSYLSSEEITFPLSKTNSTEGTVSMEISIQQRTKEIQLHSYGLVILKENTTCVMSNGENIAILSVEDSEKYKSRIIITLGEILPKGTQATLKISYTGKIGTSVTGYFHANRVGEKPATVTMNQPAYSRTVVPCFDEPSLKAPWEVSLEHPPEFTAISNQEVVNTQILPDGFARTSFAPTFPMSSYVLGFAVSDFERNCKTTASNITLCVSSSPNRDSTIDVLKEAVSAMAVVEELFDLPYNYSKLDVFMAPHYFTGAFESWGVITMEEESCDTPGKYILTHELVHQWVGDMATAWDWGHLWLNEGLTSFCTVVAFCKLANYSEYEVFWKLQQLYAFNKSRNDVHPSVFTFDDDHPIDKFSPDYHTEWRTNSVAHFDATVYEKSGSIIYMLDMIIGRNTTMKLLNNYLKKFQYSAATSEDFLNLLDQIVPEPVENVKISDFMRNWLYQAGFPVLQVSRLNQSHISITQIPCPDTLYGNIKENTWIIPLWYKIDGKTEQFRWILDREPLLLHVPLGSVLIVNPNRQGFYHAMYTAQLEIDMKRHGTRVGLEYRWFDKYDAAKTIICDELKRQPGIRRFCQNSTFLERNAFTPNYTF